METRLKFKLTKPARSKGGDRYECDRKGDLDFMVIYIPQSMSREKGVSKESLTITISD